MIDSPIIIIGSPRSGTTILQRCLALHPALWHLRAESHYILEGPIRPSKIGRMSNRCVAEDIDEDTAEFVRGRFYEEAMNVSQILEDPGWIFSTNGLAGRVFSAAMIKALGTISKMKKSASIRFLEKTPKNSLRVSLLDRLFPDALFVWNRRRPKDNIDSLVAGWNTSDTVGPIELPRFSRFGYSVAGNLDLQEYSGKWWKFALVPEWESLRGKSLGEVAGWQYYQCNRYAHKDLAKLEDERVVTVQHEQFVRNPVKVTSRILSRAGLSISPAVEQFASALPRVNSTHGTEEEGESGLRYPEQVKRALTSIPRLEELKARLGY